MSGSRDALARLRAAVEPLLGSTAIPTAAKMQAARADAPEDFLAVAEAIVPLIVALETASDEIDTHAKRLRAALADVMDETGAATIRGTTHTASVSRGRAGVVITDEAAIPPHLMRQPPPAPDKAAIAKLLNEGEAVAGASLSNAMPQLTIRRREK